MPIIGNSRRIVQEAYIFNRFTTDCSLFLSLSMFCHGDKGQRDIYYQIVLYSFPVTNYYSNTKGPQLGQKTLYFAKWWGNPKGLLGQMPHYSTVLKNALCLKHGRYEKHFCYQKSCLFTHSPSQTHICASDHPCLIDMVCRQRGLETYFENTFYKSAINFMCNNY